jgi:hypothetical protein
VFPCRVAEVVIAASDDTGPIRTAVGEALNWWNGAHAELHQVVLLPRSGPPLVPDAERFDDPQRSDRIRDRCDVLIAAFDPLGRNVVNVMADVVRAKRAGTLVLAWLIAESPSRGVSAGDQAWLSDVTQRLTEAGVCPHYIGHTDSRFESRLHGAITADLSHTNLSPLTQQYEREASARQVKAYRTPVTLLGPQVWAVTVMNHSTSLAVGLKVLVDAVDSDGNDLPDGAERSQQPITEVFSRLRTDPWPDAHRPSIDPTRATPAGPQVFPNTPVDVVAAHTAVSFPRWLRPNQRASALYAVKPHATLRVRIQFEDEAGEVWSRTNEAEPERVSSPPPSRGERSSASRSTMERNV